MKPSTKLEISMFFKSGGALPIFITVLGITAAMMITQLFHRYEEAKRKAAIIQIYQLEAALANYHLDNNIYPSTEQGLQVLVEMPKLEPLAQNYPKGGYLDSPNIPLDPWGNPYIYHSPGVNGEKYSIESYGADGVKGGEGKEESHK
jgi:general secretion pathway protein G